jgi:hypothetical protein
MVDVEFVKEMKMKIQSGLNVVSAFFWTFWATLSLAGLIQHSDTGYFYVFGAALAACFAMHHVTLKAIQKFIAFQASKTVSH